MQAAVGLERLYHLFQRDMGMGETIQYPLSNSA
jgi:hypothetical protein